MTSEQMNPLSDFFKGKNGTRLTEQQAQVAKIGAFFVDADNAQAYDEKNNAITLGQDGAKLEDVDKIAGVWRIQHKFPHKITHVRDKDMVLMQKLDHKEKTLFEFYRAKFVSYNCYGPFVNKDDAYDYIVAKYDTDKETYWSYGNTIEQARAFMGIKLYDEYKDLINSVACQNKIKSK